MPSLKPNEYYDAVLKFLDGIRKDPSVTQPDIHMLRRHLSIPHEELDETLAIMVSNGHANRYVQDMPKTYAINDEGVQQVKALSK